LGLAAGYAPREVSAAAAEVALVPPLAIGSVPVTAEVKLTPVRVPPRVSEPEEVTVPVRVRPLTVPVPLTDVTVPAPPVAAMVIPPALLVTLTPEPAVIVAAV
jgi:hypothetical protein